jgi:L-amino acid N-acyltransferase YncA
LEIRLAIPADAAQIQAIYAPFVRDTVISFEAQPPSEEEFRKRITGTLMQLPWLVSEDGGAVTGYAYAGQHESREAYRWSVYASVYVHADHYRRGVGKALYASLFACLRLQAYYNAYAGITLPNPASVGFHEAMGFTPVGVYTSVGHKFGQWHDVGWWQLRLQALVPEPPKPKLLQDVVGTNAWKAALGQS